jgi:hypothetical protein
MPRTRSEWIEAVKAADSYDIKWLSPCMGLCGKWATCKGEECPKDLQILHNLWRGKVVAINADI